jgi:hypothetical protein
MLTPSKKTLMRKEIERLENTSAAALLICPQPDICSGHCATVCVCDSTVNTSPHYTVRLETA